MMDTIAQIFALLTSEQKALKYGDFRKRVWNVIETSPIKRKKGQYFLRSSALSRGEAAARKRRNKAAKEARRITRRAA